MTDKKVSMADLQKAIETFLAEAQGAEVIRLDSNQKELGPVPAAELKKAMTALGDAAKAVGDVCQQPVLAVVLRKS